MGSGDAWATGDGVATATEAVVVGMDGRAGSLPAVPARATDAATAAVAVTATTRRPPGVTE